MSSNNLQKINNRLNGNRRKRVSNMNLEDKRLEWENRKKANLENLKEEESNDLDLYTEYVQWDFINNVLYNIGERMLNISNKYKQEFTNTLQRWFIYINEHFNDVPKYSYYPILPKVGRDHMAAEFLRTAIVDKKFAYADYADTVVERILEIIEENHERVVPYDAKITLTVRYDVQRNMIGVGDFQSPIIPRIELLVAKAGVVASAKMLLRYESFGNGSYQWGDPREVHRVLFDKFGVRYEGFASPVNSRFIEYDNTHFCSLFPETDHIFGSLGNFFHVDMDKHIGGWSVNPPFLNDLMKQVADRIIHVLDHGYKGYFFCTFPCWEDDEGWKLLNASKHLWKRFDLRPQHFIVQDAYGHTFKPKMSMNMFLMGELPSTVSKLTELGNILILDSVNVLPTECNW